VLKPLRYKVGGPSEVFASSRAAFCGMRPHGYKSLTGCLLGACSLLIMVGLERLEVALRTEGEGWENLVVKGLFHLFVGEAKCIAKLVVFLDGEVA